jgi:putative PIN family toxin of toxin-antitoxin system
MKLVVDTNVFVSAALKNTSWPGETLRWLDRYGGLLKTDLTESEILSVLARPRISTKITPIVLFNVRRLLAEAETVLISETIAACRDPDDDKFLALAVNGNADAIITGDADLLDLHACRGIPIITPAAFCNARA